MKRAISMLMVTALIMVSAFSLGSFANAVCDVDTQIMSDKYLDAVAVQTADSLSSIQRTSAQDLIKSAAYLYSLEDEPVAILYSLDPCGYAILDFENLVVLEYSKESDHPYSAVGNSRYYYNGVLEYYQKDGNAFVNLTTGETLGQSDCLIYEADDFYATGILSPASEVTPMAAQEGPVYLENDTRLYNCNARKNFSYFYPDATAEEIADMPGVCGSLACAVLVAYCDDYRSELAGSGDFADNWRKESGSSSDNTYGIDLVDELVDYVEPSGNGSFLLNPGMSSYLSDHGISGSCLLSVLPAYTQTKNCIDDDLPLIVGTLGHYSVGAGYKNISAKQIYVNDGGGSCKWINSSTVISTWYLYLY